MRRPLLGHGGEELPPAFRVQLLAGGAVAPHEVVLEIGEEHAHGAEDAGLPWHNHLPYTQLHGHRGRVHRPGAPAHHHGHGFGIEAVVDDHVADAGGHAGIDHLEGGPPPRRPPILPAAPPDAPRAARSAGSRNSAIRPPRK